MQLPGHSPVQLPGTSPESATDGPEAILCPMTTTPPPDPWRYTARYPVRQYELDLLGHVNNAVYLNWVEQVAVEHVEALGFGRDWAAAHDGTWVVHEHHVTYRGAARYGDVVLVTTLPIEIGGVRGLRRTEIRREADGALLTEVETQWIWVRSGSGRPARVPADLVELFRGGSRSTFGDERMEEDDPDDHGHDE